MSDQPMLMDVLETGMPGPKWLLLKSICDLLILDITYIRLYSFCSNFFFQWEILLSTW